MKMAGTAGRTIQDTEMIYTSRIFKFVIGQEGKEFYVHEGLVAPWSEAINRMLQNGMRESQEGVVVFKDLDTVVFASFLDFATYRNYKFQRSQDPKIPQVDHRSPEKRCDSLRDHLVPYQGTGMMDKRPYLKYMYLFVESSHTGRIYGPASGPAELNPPFDVELDLSISNREFGEVTRHHVKLYAFAEQWGVSELKQLCLHKIHSCLTWVKLSNSGYNLLFDIINLAYSSTMPGDKLRKLLNQMCVADITMIRGMPGFSRLAHDLPEIAVDILLEEPKYWEEKAKALEDVIGKFRPPIVEKEMKGKNESWW
ncbi:hypothetical protein CkaCkLH20_07927 [Colletotrichum karsti]|uniref:BTB domain-containing protein n=1 Tax=Colletotrichum karsti TaxID=1095194 RepID=A0A9P6I2U1_9PEZI|nr:uncharacterized protein CkaCkLH20_07927 [Colletotrichum karsti]KAF9874790.1 hypothetical protein CkaCkLH20_07927 [Colletotrichum karsti]